tara:strand:- start:281 stop:658 length:378 start_codon:yes stop_codon:yes gene_type:complete
MSNNLLNKRTRDIFEENDNVSPIVDIDIQEENIIYKSTFVLRGPVTEKVETIHKELTAAERMYAKHLLNVKKYQQKNPDKMKVKSKRYMVKLKEDKVRYAEYLKKRRIYNKKRSESIIQSTSKSV